MAFNQRRKPYAMPPARCLRTTLNQTLFGKRAEQLGVERFAELSFSIEMKQAIITKIASCLH